MFLSVLQILYESFEEIYHKYKEMMTHLAYSILKDHQHSEDAVQEAMTNLSKNRAKIEKLEEKELHHFVYVITRNCAIEVYRKRKKDWENEITVHFAEEESLSDIEGVSDVKAFCNEFGFSEEMVDAMNKLEPIDKDILCYKYGAGYNAVEIGVMLGKSSDYVNKRLQRAKKKLAQILENTDGAEL